MAVKQRDEMSGPLETQYDQPTNGMSEELSRALGAPSLPRPYVTMAPIQKMRNLRDVERRFFEEARLAGEDFYYGWGAGKNRIEGPSIRLAMALARCWGNVVIEARPVQELPDSWVFTAAFIDLETGFTLERQFRQSKAWVVHGNHDDQRKMDIRFQIGQSKAARNVVLNALPRSLADRGIDKAKEGTRERIEEYIKKNSKAGAVDYILKALGKVGVKEKLVLQRCGRATKEGLDIDDLVVLKGDLAAIQAGQERPDELFPPDQTDKVAAKLAAKQQEAASEPERGQEGGAGKPASKKQLGVIRGHLSRLGIAEGGDTTGGNLDAMTAEEADALLHRLANTPTPAANPPGVGDPANDPDPFDDRAAG